MMCVCVCNGVRCCAELAQVGDREADPQAHALHRALQWHAGVCSCGSHAQPRCIPLPRCLPVPVMALVVTMDAHCVRTQVAYKVLCRGVRGAGSGVMPLSRV